MDHLLLIDTTSKLCSVAITENDQIIASEETSGDFDHAARLTPSISKVVSKAGLKLSDLSAIAISAGPGSYTGLRIGTATAKALCFALQIPLIAVDTLEALATHAIENNLARPQELLVPIIDSRKEEIYASILDQNLSQILKPSPVHLAEEPFAKFLQNHDLFFVGHAIKKVGDYVKEPRARFSGEITHSSENLATSAYKSHKIKAHKNIIYFEPLYLKDVYIRIRSK